MQSGKQMYSVLKVIHGDSWSLCGGGVWVVGGQVCWKRSWGYDAVNADANAPAAKCWPDRQRTHTHMHAGMADNTLVVQIQVIMMMVILNAADIARDSP